MFHLLFHERHTVLYLFIDMCTELYFSDLSRYEEQLFVIQYRQPEVNI
jgi:hypothetical protein